MLRQPKPRPAHLLSKIVAIPTAVHVSPSTAPPPSPFPSALCWASKTSPPGTRHQLFAGIPQRDAFFFFPQPTFHLEHTAAHCFLLKNGTLSHGPTRTSLLMAYADVGDLGSSLLLLKEQAACRDVLSWIATMTAFSKNRHFHGVIDLFQEMVKILEQMDSTALVIALSALSKSSELVKGRVLHCMIFKKGFDSDTSVCNALVDLYAKGGDLVSSESMFRGARLKDVVTWNSLIRGCWFNGFAEKVAFYFRQMSFSGLRFDQVTLSCVLSACSYLTELYGLGEVVHSWVVKSSYMSHTSVANSLISFYSKCSNVEAAEKVFKDLLLKNIVSWNSMINGLVQNGRPTETLDVLQEMQSTMKIQPDSVTVIAILQLCAEFSLFREGTAIHGFIIRREMGTFDLSVMNSLIDMYVKCTDLTSADILFNTMACRDIISWNTMIYGYSHNGCRKEQAWCLFCELLKTGLRCTIGTLLGILPSFSCPKDLYLGKLVHCWMLKYGLSNSVSAVNALILMYINCGDLLSSSFLFKGMLFLSDIISWNTVIVGCVQNGYFLDALQLFFLMLWSLHTKPDPITLVNVLSACGQLDLFFFGKCLHGFTVKALMGSHVRVKNALITMYSRCKDMKSSEFIFQESEARNLCSWNCMISGYAQNSKNLRALELFSMMGTLQPDETTMVGLLCACAQLGALRQGMQIHGHVIRLAVHDNTYVTASLVDMYSKCARLDITMRVFEKSVVKSVVTWNSMILAYGFHGYGREAIKLFAKMCEMGTKPTKSTFISVLSACSHSGFVDEGWKHFNLMSEEFGIVPATEHCVCIVDMLGRAGKLNEAHDFIKQMSMKPEPGIWGALLSACKYHTNLEMGKSVAEYLFHNEPENVGYYVSLSNLYAALGKWNDAVNVRRMIECRGLTKPRGYSFVGVRSCV